MCGRFACWSDKDKILEHYRLEEGPAYYSGYNIYPTRDILAVREQGDRELVNLHWGFLPAWAKDKKFETSLATAEKILDKKPFFRDAFKKRRCLVPVNGYFEWHEQSRPKQPFFIKLRDSEIFSLAGIWDTWEGPAGPREGLAIITIPPHAQIARIHHRSPVIIEPQDYAEWLQEGGEKFIVPYAGQYDYWPVSTRVNSPQNQGQEIIARIPWPASVPQWAQ